MSFSPLSRWTPWNQLNERSQTMRKAGGGGQRRAVDGDQLCKWNFGGSFLNSPNPCPGRSAVRGAQSYSEWTLDNDYSLFRLRFCASPDILPLHDHPSCRHSSNLRPNNDLLAINRY